MNKKFRNGTVKKILEIHNYKSTKTQNCIFLVGAVISRTSEAHHSTGNLILHLIGLMKFVANASSDFLHLDNL